MKNFRRWGSFFLVMVMAVCVFSADYGGITIEAKKTVRTEEKKAVSEKETVSKKEAASEKEENAADDAVQTSMETRQNRVVTSYQMDQELEAYARSGRFSPKNPYIAVNPYGTSPLPAVVLFTTKEKCAVLVTVCGRKKGCDVSGTVTELTKNHKVPIIGLYAGKRNRVRIQLLNKKGRIFKTFSLKIQTQKLPRELKKAVLVKKHKEPSAYGLTVVSGFDTPHPFAFDENGDIRWYMSGVYDTYGYFPLSNRRFLLMDGEISTQTFIKPMSQAVNEMDYLGRVYQTYMVKQGVHHEVIEKTPGGNFLVLTNSLKNHCEDCVQEIDRKTGQVVKTLDMGKIFGKKFKDMTDWAHLNTVSYNEKNHCILVSVRNCDAVVKLNWDTDKIVWILGDKSLYQGTKLYKYLLKPKKGDSGFYYQYQQHSAYEVLQNLDDNKNTVEIMMFDNHFVSKRPVPGYDGKKRSYVTIYSVNEKKRTVEIWKSFPGVKSKVYSNYRFEQEKGRVFYMGGCLKRAWKPGHRKGVICEFDYASEKLLNIYSLKNTFYRAYGIEPDFDVCAEPLTMPENPVLGEMYTFEKTLVNVDVPWYMILSDKISCYLLDNALCVHSGNHQVTKIELVGLEQSYYFVLPAQDGGEDKFPGMELSTMVSLEGVEPGRYQVVITADRVRQNAKEMVTIGS